MATANKPGQVKIEKNPAAAKSDPPAAKDTKASKGKEKAEKKQKAAADLASELKKLRATLKEIVQQVSLGIDTRIADTLLVLEKKQTPGELNVLPRSKASLQLTKKLQGLKLKPARGKLKDIAYISRLVEKIAGKMPKQS